MAAFAGQASAASLSLEASAQKLVAGRDEPLVLTARGGEALRDARTVCSNGTLQRKGRSGTGELRYELTAPRTADPGWLVCAIASPATRSFATVTLELQRREVLALANLPPLSRVEVKIGPAVFGPVRANGAGFAEVTVLLSPRVRQAEVIATPPGKPAQVRQQTVSPPPSPQAVVLGPLGEVKADGATQVPVFAFTFNDRGELASDEVTATSDEGSFQSELLAPGVHLLVFTPYPRATEHEASLTVRGAAGKPALLKLPLTPGVRPIVELRSNVTSIPADGVAAAELAITVRDERGQPLAFQNIELLASAGSVTPVEDRGGGQYAARYISPAGSGTQAHVTAIVEGGATATLTLNLVPPPRLTVDANPKEAPADGRTRVLLSIVARGADGRQVPDGSVLRLSSSLGEVPATIVTAAGRATAELLTGTVAGVATIDIRSADATANVQVRVVPGPAATVAVSPERDAITCDGTDSVLVRLSVRDAHGNGVSTAPVEVYEEHPDEGARGRFDRVETLGAGEFQVRYHAPLVCDRPQVALLASSGGIKTSAQVRLVRGFTNALGLTARFGAGHNLGRIGSGAVELEGDLPVARVSPRLLATVSVALALSAPYSAPGFSPARGAFVAEGSTFVASIFLGPRWTLFEDDRAHLYVGGGLDAHVARSPMRLTFSGLGTSEEYVGSGFAAGGHLRLGGGYALGPGLAVAQVRLGLAAPFLTRSSNIRSQVSGLGLAFGYRLPLR